MKNLFVASLFLGLGSMAHAAVITANCTPAPLTINGQSGNGTENCTVAYSNVTVTSITFQSFVSLLESPKNPGPFTGTYILQGPGTMNSSGTASTAGVVTQTTTACDTTCLNQLATGAFSIADSYVGNPGVVAASFDKTITITYTQNTAGTPEPASFGLIGVGLMSLCLFRRKA